MKFLFKVLPTLLLILLIALIYFGGKSIVTFVNENPEAYAATFVTENAQKDRDNETYSAEETLSDVNEKDFNSQINKKEKIEKDDFIEGLGDDSEFDEDFVEGETDNPEATLDAELEGKSSNQLIAANDEKPRKVSKKKAAPSTSKKESVEKKTNEKPSNDDLTVKGDVPKAYNKIGSEQFMVIAGSFKSKDNANIFIDDLEKKGIKDIEIIEMKSKNLNRVCISRHASYENAKQVINQLKKVYNVDAYVHRKAN